MTKHKNAPWRLKDDRGTGGAGLVVWSENQGIVALLGNPGHMPDANLIVAAPAMLAALERAAPWLGKLIADGGHNAAVMPNDAVRTLQMVEAAIAQAKGAK